MKNWNCKLTQKLIIWGVTVFVHGKFSTLYEGNVLNALHSFAHKKTSNYSYIWFNKMCWKVRCRTGIKMKLVERKA